LNLSGNGNVPLGEGFELVEGNCLGNWGLSREEGAPCLGGRLHLNSGNEWKSSGPMLRFLRGGSGLAEIARESTV